MLTKKDGGIRTLKNLIQIKKDESEKTKMVQLMNDVMKDIKKNTNTQSEKIPKLNKKMDSQKVRREKGKVEKGLKPLFSKDVNDPFERVMIK